MIGFNKSALLTAFSLVGAVVMSTNASAYFGNPGTQVAVKKTTAIGSPYGYYEYLPLNYSDSGAKVPVVLFLHGIGERGDGVTNLYKVERHGPPKLAKAGKDFPAIVISPQTSGNWTPSVVNSFVDYIFRTYRAADPSRLYVTGLSMGGGGTWDYAAAYASRVAAAVPICGATGGNRSSLYGKGVWAFHAYDDRVVSYSRTTGNLDTITPTSTSLISGYPKVGTGAAATDMIALYSSSTNSHRWYSGNTTTDVTSDRKIRYTVYRSGNHDSWTRAYNNPDLWNWLFRQSTSVSAPAPAPVPAGNEIRVDFGDNGLTLPSGWNNGRSLVHSGSIALRTSTGVLTPFDLTVRAPFNNVNRDGTTTPISTLGIPVTASRDSFYGNDVIYDGRTAPKAVLEVRDLDPAKSYSFSFFASRMNVSDNRETRYTVVGATTSIVNLNAANNTSIIATATVKPSSNGIVRIDITKGTRNTNAMGAYYLGSMRIRY
jgi:pimeloyl-ACP methyl ester carboxylesterase